MATNTPPKLMLVAHNDEAALRRRGAVEDLRWNTLSMVPNLLAVMRGAGRPKDLAKQLIELSAALQHVEEFAEDGPAHLTLAQILRSDLPPVEPSNLSSADWAGARAG